MARVSNESNTVFLLRKKHTLKEDENQMIVSNSLIFIRDSSVQTHRLAFLTLPMDQYLFYNQLFHQLCFTTYIIDKSFLKVLFKLNVLKFKYLHITVLFT